MIISDEQALAAMELIREHPVCDAAPGAAVTPEVMEAALHVVDETPDIRPDRVEEAVRRMHDHTVDAHEIADKMISRIVSDSLR